ncbi:peptidoglycan DD-metalloendopeptidase family protein [Kribbella qitaiheensis]|uniref:Peptidoglycan DD-metalloendopeptidase family protein n=1 Tax=Kribbella qitaiheensis TaxID=1544730 RepID=A0A7G6X973_9ACTN|nr:peptidoglycan DD-metalloendopeptidase family protein [Kribbella qitaiheensis]
MPTASPGAYVSTSPSAASAGPPAAVATFRGPPPGAAPRGGVWPLSPRPEIVRGFELPAKPWLPGHRGLDLAGSPGQPVLAATAGTITYAGPLAGRGVVVVTTGLLRTTYEPVIPSVRVGATVTPGQQLGTLSLAGTHCPPHTCLHWGLRNATTYVNPLTLLTSRPVRLLPSAQPQTSPAQPPTADPPQAPPTGTCPAGRPAPTTQRVARSRQHPPASRGRRPAAQPRAPARPECAARFQRAASSRLRAPAPQAHALALRASAAPFPATAAFPRCGAARRIEVRAQRRSPWWASAPCLPSAVHS